jgi:hypothetical protein
MTISAHDISTAAEKTRLERISRKRHLTPEEAAKYDKVRKDVKKDLPELFARNKISEKDLPELFARNEISEKVRQRLGLETLATRNRDSLDFHDISVSAIKDVINMVFEAGRQFEAKQNRRKRGPGKRFRLLHVYGSVDPSIVGKSYKDYDSLLKAARKFIKSDDYTEGEDGLFYVVTTGNTARVSPFDSSDLEDEN